MARRSPTWVAPENPEVRRLKEDLQRAEGELFNTRCAMIQLMPEEIAAELMGFYSCHSERDFFSWRRSVVDNIVGRAVPVPEASVLQPRGWCPLCRGGSSGPYATGFTLPEGLRRHLEGFGNVSQCPVTTAAFALGRDALADRFAAARKADVQREHARRAGELLFLVDVAHAPKLREEDLPGWQSTPRDDAELEAMEQQLSELGFGREVQGNVVSYRLIRAGYLVLADPRAHGRVDFTVMHEEDRARHPDCSSFYLLDMWVKDRKGKFERRLSSAMDELAAREGKRAKLRR